MQTAITLAIERALISLWPKIEPLILSAAAGIVMRLAQAAKDHAFPERWKFLEPVVDSIADDVIAALEGMRGGMA